MIDFPDSHEKAQKSREKGKRVGFRRKLREIIFAE